MSGADLVFYALIPAVIVALVPVVWVGAAIWRPTMFVMNGHWEAARIAAERVEASWLRVLPGALSSARYAKSLAFHLEGRFEDSMGALPENGELLEAGNLVMLNRDPKRAVQLLTAICEDPSKPKPAAEDLLLLAVARHMAGKRTKAQATFERAGVTRPKRAPWPRLNEPIFHYLRALYLVRTGRATEAQKDLELAAASPIATIYVERARALLPPTSERDVEPRSSLDAQVMDE